MNEFRNQTPFYAENPHRINQLHIPFNRMNEFRNQERKPLRMNQFQDMLLEEGEGVSYFSTSTPLQNAMWFLMLRAAGLGSG